MFCISWILKALLAVGGAVGGTIIIKEFFSDNDTKKIFNKKKTLLAGPIGSGKTTFLRAIVSADERKNIKDGPTGQPQTYKVGDTTFDEVTDMSGSQEFLKGRFNEYIKENDYILCFFDVNQYLANNSYKEDVNGRIEFIH